MPNQDRPRSTWLQATSGTAQHVDIAPPSPRRGDPNRNKLEPIYCVRRDQELLALALEQMTPDELLEVIAKLLARGAHAEAAELVAWIRGRTS